MAWTCRKCRSRHHGNTLRCPKCGRARPKPRATHRTILTERLYDDWVREYGETCGICGRAPTKRRRLDRDHDHRTGQARGLLCHACNRALPNWVTATWLRAAANYLENAA